MVLIGANTKRKIQDYKLSRYAFQRIFKKINEWIGRKYSVRYLFDIRKLYLFVKVHPMGAQLTVSHCRLLFTLKDSDEIEYYINQVLFRKLGKRDLELKIKNNEYKRIPIESRGKLIRNEKLEIKDLVPNPILIKNVNNIEIATEHALHDLILEDITGFMKELGDGFSFIDSEYKIKIGDRYNYIDFLLFNIKYNSYVVIELKVTEYKAEYVAQVQKYMNYIDKNIKEVTNNNTIGILICKKENKFMIEYCSDDRIAVREYHLVWYNV